jgi:hypothetical protein
LATLGLFTLKYATGQTWCSVAMPVYAIVVGFVGAFLIGLVNRFRGAF